MFSHIMIGTNDLDKAKAFYDSLLGTLGVPPGRVDRHRVFYRTPTGVFSVSKPIDGKPATVANGGTIGFAASSPEQAAAWHAAGIAGGGKTCEDPPACAKAAPARSISPTCAIPTATNSARCTGSAEPERARRASRQGRCERSEMMRPATRVAGRMLCGSCSGIDQTNSTRSVTEPAAESERSSRITVPALARSMITSTV